MGFKAYRVGADSLELRVQEFKVSGLGFGAWGKGLVMGLLYCGARSKSCIGLRSWGLGFRVQGSGFKA